MTDLRAWERRMRERAKEIDRELARELARTPGAFAMLALLQRTKPYQLTHDQDPVKRARAMRNPDLHQLARLIPKPSMHAVRTLEAACGRSYAILQDWWDGPSGMADLIAGVIGLELEPPPPPPEAR